MISKAITYYLNSYRGLSRGIWLLAMVNLINRAGTMVIPFLSVYMTSQRGFSVTNAGIIMGLFGIGAMIGGFLGGKLTDKHGYFKVQLLALTIGGILFVILGHLTNYILICGCTFFLGCINEAFRPANTAAMGALSTPETRTRSFTLMRLSFNLGWAVGVGIAGFIAHYSYTLLFWVDGITNILAAIGIFLFIPPPQSKTQEDKKNANSQFSIFDDRTYIKFALVSVLFLSCFVQLFTNLPIYFKNVAGLNERMIGFVSSWNGLLIVLTEMTVIYWLERHWSKRKSVIIGLSLFIIAYLILIFFKIGLWGAFIMMTFITVSEILTFSVMVNFWMSRTNDDNRGQYAGIWTMTWALAQSAGPFLGSLVIDHLSYEALWIIICGLTAISMYFYNAFYQVERNP
ncbi:MAG: MFS transporter [Chitinophagales bacterium]|nr:MFS transporter [Chitinophagales bacterium]